MTKQLARELGEEFEGVLQSLYDQIDALTAERDATRKEARRLRAFAQHVKSNADASFSEMAMMWPVMADAALRGEKAGEQ